MDEPGTVSWLIENLKHLDPAMYVYMESDLKFSNPRRITDVTFVLDRSWEGPPIHEDHVVLS